MSLRDQVTTVRAAVAVAATVAAALLWLFTIHATAQGNRTELRSAQEQLELLTDLHKKADGAAEGKRKLVIKLCSEAKLIGPECCEVGALRGCPPTPPVPPNPRPPSGGP